MNAPATSLPIEETLRLEDLKRRRREGIVIAVTVVMILVFAFIEVQPPDAATESSLLSNISFFLLINLNIILFGLLAFLVVRNLVKVFWESKRGARRSRLQWQLVLAMVGLSLGSNLLLFFVAGGFVTRAFDRWFDPQIGAAVKGAAGIQETYYQSAADNAIGFAKQLGQQISQQRLVDAGRSDGLRSYVQAKQREYRLGALQVISPERQILAVSVDPEAYKVAPIEANGEFLKQALRGQESVTTQEFGEGEVIRAAAPLRNSQEQIAGALVVDYYVDKSLRKQSKLISESYGQFKRQEVMEGPLKYTYVGTLLLVTLVVILVALWFGLYLARGITVPIQKLADGTHQVAQGNLDYKIEAAGDDEVGVLVNSFNSMTADLKRSRIEIERHGKLVEMLLANIAAGVVSIDPSGTITTWNKAAAKMLNISAAGALGKKYQEVFQAEFLAAMRELVDNAQGQETLDRQIQLPQADPPVTLVVIAAALCDEDGKPLGVLLFLEDITQIQKVQRMEAWREVAQRLAHEIKNPLTPIQLSAERLRKRYAPLLQGDGAILDKCTSTIIAQVEELKNLVNSFSQFNRLPTAQISANDLNEIVRDALFLYQEGHDEIDFQFNSGTLPDVNLDRVQMKRALVNLLDNAVAAVQSENHSDGQIILTSQHDAAQGCVRLTIADNGAGLPAHVRAQMFEPYFSTKKNGTGLGLSIVNAIVDDHHGRIRVVANEPRGTKFVIELPAAQVQEAQRARTVLNS
ncbi:MAG: HAMP domain-containing protein [Deltaproteobacteria bacterium]|nr:HAMP domain-containing protein [Deltaproteobacteria bacterium]